MNEATQAALTELLQKVLKGIDTAASFSAEQLPAVIQELLMWNLVSSLLIQIVSVIYIVLFCIYFPKVVTYGTSYECQGAHEPMCFFGCVAAVIMAIVALLDFFSNFDWIKIWIAPKLYLLDYTAVLIK